MKILFPVNTRVLKRAREQAGFTIEDVRGEFKKIELWESGQETPTYSAIKKISKKYKKPSAYFLFPAPVIDKERLEKFRNMRDGKLPPNLIHLVNKAIKYQDNLKSIFIDRDKEHPHFSKIKIDLRNPETSARNTLEYIDEYLSDLNDNREGRLKNIRSVLEAMGIFVFKDDFSTRIGRGSEKADEDGFCIYDKDFPIIVLNNNTAQQRQLFTLCHELFHILSGDNSLVSTTDAYQEELAANIFASEFLVPQQSLRQYIKQNNFNSTHLSDEETIKKIANHYEVSRYVIAIKLSEINVIDNILKNTYLNKFKKDAKNYKKSSRGGNYYFTNRAYLSPRYVDAVSSLYHEGKLTPTDLGKSLSMKPAIAHRFVKEFV